MLREMPNKMPNGMLSRWLLSLALAFAGLLALVAAPALAQDGKAPVIEIFHESGCRPCGDWEKELRAAGFTVRRSEVLSVANTRRWLAVPENFASFVTARTGGYIIEGPVPPALILRLLQDKPTAQGLARPGNPAAARSELMLWGGLSQPFPATP